MLRFLINFFNAGNKSCSSTQAFMRSNTNQGISIIEAMVAMVVLSIGFLGMAGMLSSIAITKGNRSHFENAVSLAKAKTNELSELNYDVLGTGTTAAEKIKYGGLAAEVTSQMNLNVYGQTDDGTAEGPFIYNLHHMVCQDALHPSKVTVYDQDPNNGDPCAVVNSDIRPNSLHCDESEFNDNEVQIRVSVSYRARNGECKEVSFVKYAINYE